jgi:KaiC/GvpD/RAD55 family RecA-like ATPase
MIRIKQNKKPNMPICEMICDKELHPKLNEYDLTKFLNCHSTTLIIGKPGSGKTNLLYSFMKSKKLLNKCFDKIFLFQPEQSRASMKDKFFDQLPDDQKFDELTIENLDMVDDNLDEEGNNLIIFDDMTAYLKNNETRKKLKELVMNRRHKHLSIFFLVQTYYSVEKDIRKLFSNIFIFRVSKKEMENIFDEVIETHKSYIPDITKLVFDKPYKYLFVNTDSQRLFSGFDEILIGT